MSHINEFRGVKSVSRIPQNRIGEKKKIFGGKAPKGVIICQTCHNIYFKKEWHRPMSNKLVQQEFKGEKISMKPCPACKMKNENLYEGEIIIEKVPALIKTELVHLVANFAERAKMRDPQDRILHFDVQGSGYRITTTENQLAVKLAKKIKDVFGKADVDIRYSQEPFEVVNIKIKFK